MPWPQATESPALADETVEDSENLSPIEVTDTVPATPAVRPPARELVVTLFVILDIAVTSTDPAVIFASFALKSSAFTALLITFTLTDAAPEPVIQHPPAPSRPESPPIPEPESIPNSPPPQQPEPVPTTLTPKQSKKLSDKELELRINTMREFRHKPIVPKKVFAKKSRERTSF